jgi:ComEC/Rec2-related protein
MSEQLVSFRSPVLGLILGGVLGTLLVSQLFSPAVLTHFIVASIVVLILALLTLFHPAIPNGVGVLLLGIGLFGVLGSVTRYNQSVRRGWINNQRLHFTGTFRSPHEFNTDTINGEPESLRLYVLDVPSFLRGRFTHGPSQRIEFTGRAEWYDLSRDFRFFLTNRGYHGAVRTLKFHRVGEEDGSSRGLTHWKNQILGWLSDQETAVPYTASLLQALIVGERNFPTHLELLFRRFGMVHLFVISGFHVGFLFWFLHGFTRGIPSLPRQLLILLILVTYLSFLGWPLSATRAGIMIGVGALAVQLNRRTGLLDVLFLTVLLLMLWDPFVVLNAGFQLTVGAVFGIQLLNRPGLSRDGFSGREFLRMNLGAFLGTLPVILYHFQYVAPLALPGSLLAGLLFPVLLTILGVQTVLLLAEWSLPVAWIEWGLGQTVAGALKMLQYSGWIWQMSEVPVVFAVLLSVLLFVVVASFLPRTIRLAAAGLALVLVLWFSHRSNDPFLEVRRVREANVLLLRTDGRRNLLVVPPGERLNGFQVDAINQVLRDRGVHHLDYFVSPYNRRLFFQFDPGFTVERFVTYWGTVGRLSWEGGYFDVDELQLQSRFVNVDFEGPVANVSLSSHPSVIGTTSDGRCLLGDSSRLDLQTFEKIRGTECLLTFLRDGPVRYLSKKGTPETG